MFEPLEATIRILESEGYIIKDPWDVVNVFEKKVAEFTGSKYAVAIDSCTNALFLCLKYLQLTHSASVPEIVIPKNTYLSVPQTIIHAGHSVSFRDIEWQGSYYLHPLPIIDSATRLRKAMYLPHTFCCISFHKKKMLPIGKGGMILLDDETASIWLKLARYEGRHMDVLYEDDDIDMIGWNMYMTPEQAARGIMLLEELLNRYSDGIIPDCGGYQKYKDLTNLSVFKKYK